MKRKAPVLGMRAVLLAAAFFSLTATVQAAGVYKWTDADGVIHYSDRAPRAAGVEVSRLEIDARPAATSEQPGDDYFSIINQEKRLRAGLIALEEARARLAEAEAVARAATVVEPSASSAQTESTVTYLTPLAPFFHGRGFLSGHRPFQGHFDFPAHNPPMRPPLPAFRPNPHPAVLPDGRPVPTSFAPAP